MLLRAIPLSVFLSFIFAFSAKAEDVRLKNFHPDIEATYQSVPISFDRADLRKFFSNLKSQGLIDQIYLPQPGLPGVGTILFGRLQVPTKKSTFSCVALFCVDRRILDRMEGEINKGRLILVADLYQLAHSAITLNKSSYTKSFLSNWLNVDPNKSPIVISIDMSLDTLEHELFHAADDEQDRTADLRRWISNALDSKRIDARGAQTISRFLWEVRAYDHQRKVLEATIQPKEYILKHVSNVGMGITTVSAADYRRLRNEHIETSVNQFLWRMLNALPALSKNDRAEVLGILKKLMPDAGPYAFDNLVLPKIKKM